MSRLIISDLFVITDSNDNLIDPYAYVFTDRKDATTYMTNNWDKKTLKENGIKVSNIADLLEVT